jgi:hypothetical protein
MDTINTSSILANANPATDVQARIVDSLIKYGMVRFVWDCDQNGFTAGTDLIETCRSIFALGDDLDDFVCPVPDDRADLGFYRFAVNNPAGGLRQYAAGSHRGLPLSKIWNHRAATNPHWFRLVAEQRTFDQIVRRYCDIIRAITAAFTATIDPQGRIAALVGTDGHTDGSYLRVISSAGGNDSDRLEVNSRSMVTRHRAHVDTAVFVVQPPILGATTQGGRLHFLDADRKWTPLEVNSGELVVFTGRDFNTALTPNASCKYLHEVLATREEACKDRLSAFFRIGVDPQAEHIETVGGDVFRTLNGVPVTTGRDYYTAMNIHRATA